MPPPDRVKKIDPNDRAQLKEAPVSLRRILSLFAGHHGDMIIVTIMIIATSLIGLGQPFLVREIVDVAIPQQDIPVLLWCVAAMIAIAVLTQVLGILQTWISATLANEVSGLESRVARSCCRTTTAAAAGMPRSQPSSRRLQFAYPPRGILLVGSVLIYLVVGAVGHDPWKGDDAVHIGLIKSILDTGS